MADKLITDFPLISSVTADTNFVCDNTTATYRTTAAQIKAYVLADGNVSTAVLAALSVTNAKIADNTITSAKTNFTMPTVQRFTSGSGTYTTPAGVKYIKVKMCGGGGGGGFGGINSGTAATAGGSSTFGTSLLTAAGGQPGVYQGDFATNYGGAATVNSPALALVALTGGGGGCTTRDTGVAGGYGGTNPFGGAGMTRFSSPGNPGITNTGAGGGGGGNNQEDGAYTGSGGGAGGYIEAMIVSPSSTYSYAVGAAGSGGLGSGINGGAGGSGIIIVEEFYQ